MVLAFDSHASLQVHFWTQIFFWIFLNIFKKSSFVNVLNFNLFIQIGYL